MARLSDNEAKAIFADNLKRIMEQQQLDAPSLAQMMGLEKQSIYSWLKMNSFPSATNIQKLIDTLRVESDDLLARQGSTQRGFCPVPLFGSVAAGVPVEMLKVDEMKEAPTRFVDDDPDCFLVRVRGNSMNKSIQDTNFALVSPKHAEPNERDMFLVTVNGDDATIKRLHMLENGIELVPDSYDPTFRPRLFDFGDGSAPPIRILGKVVWWCAEF